MKKIAIVGAGFSGAVLGRQLAEAGVSRVDIFDQRDHIGGNCHTHRDVGSGVMLHVYGPHIFHTDSRQIWDYVNRFGEWHPYVHRVKASTKKGVFSLPVNLHTLNQYFGRRMSPGEARAFLEKLSVNHHSEAETFEDVALQRVGAELYETFFYGYTLKQWGVAPSKLPAYLFSRLPVRYSYEDSYYWSIYQGIPKDGYTAILGRILEHPSIRLSLRAHVGIELTTLYDHVFFTGSIDAFFKCRRGRLGYRTVFWERVEAVGDFQGCAQLNYTEADVPHTRVHEDKHFAPWERHDRTVALVEYSKETTADDIPYYPKRLAEDKALLAIYEADARDVGNVSFLGRLGTYRYMNMDEVIGDAMKLAKSATEAWREKRPVPLFPESA